jgi:hypothetical protein
MKARLAHQPVAEGCYLLVCRVGTNGGSRRVAAREATTWAYPGGCASRGAANCARIRPSWRSGGIGSRYPIWTKRLWDVSAGVQVQFVTVLPGPDDERTRVSVQAIEYRL